MTEQILYFNGINGATGEYLPSPSTVQQIAQIAQGEIFSKPSDLIQLQQLYHKSPENARGLIEGKDPKALAQAGWGVIFTYEYQDSSGYHAQDIREALGELLEHRRRQATQQDSRYYQEYIGLKAYRTSESKQRFLERQGVAPGPVNPEKMPYYLLIVGDPLSIPYQFQYQLDVQYAVGRIYFDTLEEYAQYAHNVVKVETGKVSLPKNIYLFGTHNQDDKATQLSAEHLVKPLSQSIAQDQPNWSVQTVVGESATKARFSQILSEAQTPALLFTATHGVRFPNNHPLQLQHQGALLCQDWPGPCHWKGELDPQTHYFCADDVSNDVNLLGLIAFHFACYSAGTPQVDDFSVLSGVQNTDIAPHAFVAQLPKRLLNRGVLAVVGHIERAWGCSFVWKELGQQLETFESAFKRLMEGHPVGSALEFFNQRYAELACDLNVELEEIKYSQCVDNWKIASLWTAKNDARNYTIIGDPAVRLTVATHSIAVAEKPTIRKKITLDSLQFANSENPTNTELTLPYSRQKFLSQQPQNNFKKMKKKILIVSANPKNTDRLRLDEEVREIQAGLERSKNRDEFEIIPKFAVRPQDLRRALLDYEPEIVHFSGHGASTQGLVLENDVGQAQLVSTEALTRLFGLFQDKVECVLMNACYSEVQAQAIFQYIDCIVGMNQEIGDEAAIDFAVGFYDALGADKSYEDAYEFGCISIDLESIPESSTPVLKTRKNTVKEIQLVSALPLENPEGQVPLESGFYIERSPIESDCYEEMLKAGGLIRIKAPRQMGKSSLMSRVLDYASKQSYQTAYLNFQSADAGFLDSLDMFLQWFCASVTDSLDLPDKLEDYWKGVLGSKNKCTNYFQRYLLKEIDSPIALGLDEVDEVFKHPTIATDFFGLLRAWHERAKNDVVWKKLRLVIVHSKEVYIPLNINQSPFNVGFPVELPELNLAQVQDLVQRHGLVWANSQVEDLLDLVGGHPYLVRVALYEIARGRMTWKQLQEIAPTEAGPYGDHLRRHLLNLQGDENLLMALKQVMITDEAVDIGTVEAFKLRSMGLVKFQGNDVMPLCKLYQIYFCDRLKLEN